MKKLLLLFSIIYFGKIHGQIISTVAGNGGCCNPIDGGQATASTLYYPSSIAFDISGNMYICEANSIRKVDISGIITTVAGTGHGGYSGDGGIATSAQISAQGVAVDLAGNIYIADWGNNRIRKVNTSGIITTIAGNGTSGISGDGGLATAAEVGQPYCVFVDIAGNIYIPNGNRIRKINTSGIITTVVGTGNSGYSGDGGPATAATLNSPYGVFVDAAGNMYIGDTYNYCVRKVNSSGIISTIAGNGIEGFSGDGGLATSAKLNSPWGVCLDGAGNLFIADAFKSVVRMVSNSGIINTVVGDSIWGYTGDGGLAVAAEIEEPLSVAIYAGDLFIDDYNAYVIRKVNNITNDINKFLAKENQINIFPNPTNNQFFIDANTTDKLTVDLYDVNGTHVFSESVSDKSNINVTTLSEGVYTMTIKSVDSVTNKKLVIVR